MQEEVSCPEWDGEAFNGVAEVKRGPEVLGISICKDVLQGKEESSGQSLAAPQTPLPQQSLSAHACRGQGPAPSHVAFLPSPGNEETPVHTTRGSAKEGCRRAALKPDGALVYPGNEASQAFLFFLSTDLAFLTPWGVTRSQSEGGSRKPGREGLLSRLAAHGWASSLPVHPPTHLSRKTPDIAHPGSLASPSCPRAR